MSLSITAHQSSESNYWHYPRIAPGTFLNVNCTAQGNVFVDPAIVFDNSSLRGESMSVGREYTTRSWSPKGPCSPLDEAAYTYVGNRVAMGDHCTLHNEASFDLPVFIGSHTVMGHQVVVHGAHVDENSILFLGANAIDASRVQAGSVLAAQSVLREGRTAPAGQILGGVPAEIIRVVDQATYDRVLGFVSYEENKAAAELAFQITDEFTDKERQKLNLSKLYYSLSAAIEIFGALGQTENFKLAYAALDDLQYSYQFGNHGKIGRTGTLKDTSRIEALEEKLRSLGGILEEVLRQQDSVRIATSSVRHGESYVYDALQLHNITRFIEACTGKTTQLGEINEFSSWHKIYGPWAYWGNSHLTTDPQAPPIFEIRREYGHLTEYRNLEILDSASAAVDTFLSWQRPAIDSFYLLARESGRHEDFVKVIDLLYAFAQQSGRTEETYVDELKDHIAFFSEGVNMEKIPENEALIKNFVINFKKVVADPEIAAAFPERVTEKFKQHSASAMEGYIALEKDPAKAAEIIEKNLRYILPSLHLAEERGKTGGAIER